MELKRLAQLENKNRGKMPEMRSKQCVFDSLDGRVMEYYNHLFVAHATPKQIADDPVFVRLLGKNMSSLKFSLAFLHATWYSSI